MNKHNYKLLTAEDLVSDSYKQINDNVEALLRGFEGSDFPDNPVKGQSCLCNDKWYTFDGIEWRPDNALHNHDASYYTKSQNYSREEIAELFTEFKYHFDRLDGPPEVFPPSTHSHTYADISNFPTSLPANGGAAATAQKLAKAVMIGDSSFNGSGNIQLVRPNNFYVCRAWFHAVGTITWWHRESYYSPCGAKNCTYGNWYHDLPAGGAWMYMYPDRHSSWFGVAAGGTRLASWMTQLYKGVVDERGPNYWVCHNPSPHLLVWRVA